MNNLTLFDSEHLRQLIENHLHYTGSARAKAILDDWDASLAKFVKIMPVEYRRALQEMTKHQEADKTGLDALEIGLRGGK